jgi:uncharacterized repeat protein (TIGR01451 family)
VLAGDPFTATLTVENKGDVALVNVRLALRGDLGSKPVDPKGPTVEASFERLEPGESRSLAHAFVCGTVGITRVLGGGRDALGWAASNAACTVEVVGPPTLRLALAEKDAAGVEKDAFAVGETYRYVFEVRNDSPSATTPDLRVVFALPKEVEFVSGTADRSISVTGAGATVETNPFVLAPNERVEVSVQVKATARPPDGRAQMRAAVRTTSGVEVATETEATTLGE